MLPTRVSICVDMQVASLKKALQLRCQTPEKDKGLHEIQDAVAALERDMLEKKAALNRLREEESELKNKVADLRAQVHGCMP